MSAEAMVKIKTDASDDWAAYLDQQLESSELKYKRITCTQLVGLTLIIYVKHEHRDHVKHQRGSAVGVGALGSMGNKGKINKIKTSRWRCFKVQIL
jgi:inositol polyphosphate 5-phosphatase INPP5B/F